MLSLNQIGDKMKIQKWKTIKGYPHHEVSNYGNVRSWKNGRHGKRDYPKQLKKYIRPDGYFTVNLSENGEQKTTIIHHIVLETFTGERPFKYDACHNDGDKNNNHLDNLRWDTRKNNQADKVKHGTNIGPRGSRHGLSKLTESDVHEIRRELKKGVTQANLGVRYNVNRSAIQAIGSKKTWAWLSETKEN